MTARQLRTSRRSITSAVALAGMASLAIGAHAALPAPDTAKAVATDQSGRPSRIALVIGNGHYPDADVPLTQPINDARTLTAALRRDGIEVDMVEDASKDDMRHAVGRLRSKIGPEPSPSFSSAAVAFRPAARAT